LTLQAEKTKQSEYDAKKADAEAKKADAEARKTEAEESSKKLAMHIEFCNKALSDYGDKIDPEMLNKIIDSVVSRS
jgi:regulator of protease activity HflC (stomatin/prohibitin superfamily)